MFFVTVAIAGASVGTVAADSPAVDRAAGPDRIATAVAVSRTSFGSASEAVLATAQDFPDALAAGALAARADAPLLLTHPGRLPGEVADELRRLGTERVWVVGGPAAIAATVGDELEGQGLVVERVAGDNRYDTARLLAREAGPSSTGEVVLALGSHPVSGRAWPDALAGASLAAAPQRVPTLLTRHDRLPPETEVALGDLEALSVVLVGGTNAISPAVDERLRGLGYAVERVAGASRYLTSVHVAERAMGAMGDEPLRLVLASGSGFADALSAGPLAAALHGPVLLVPPDRLNDGTDRWLRGRRHRLAGAVLIGGEGAVSDLVRQEVEAALRGDPRPPPPEPPPPPPPPAPVERVVGAFEGEASWYGARFAGRTTACGERFDPGALTAAHRTLPCNTRVRVTNVHNGATTTVRVNDRGPYIGGRVLDVSRHASELLGFTHAGVTWVRGEILDGAAAAGSPAGDEPPDSTKPGLTHPDRAGDARPEGDEAYEEATRGG
ncbi:MAG TPA: septal ring lytic transglycosylase RlpA family protein [Egibacteraceae bacterium]|nr:septal ring lytic transglycosylase RlpA family protein [Egibacteraceae bacterium]